MSAASVQRFMAAAAGSATAMRPPIVALALLLPMIACATDIEGDWLITKYEAYVRGRPIIEEEAEAGYIGFRDAEYAIMYDEETVGLGIRNEYGSYVVYEPEQIVLLRVEGENGVDATPFEYEAWYEVSESLDTAIFVFSTRVNSEPIVFVLHLARPPRLWNRGWQLQSRALPEDSG